MEKDEQRAKDEERAREWFAAQLWRAFPEAKTDNDLSELVAAALTCEGRPITPRTVRNWLACKNTPHFRYVPMVLALSGMEAVTDLVFGEADV